MSHDAVLKQIRELIPTLDGWCSPERACDLAQIVLTRKPKITVCLGIWGGRDTFALGLAHKELGIGKCIAVDPWKADASIAGQNEANAEWWGNQQMHDLVRERFWANLYRLELTRWVEVHQAKASEVEPPKKIGLLVVDANHGPDSIADVMKWAPNVKARGVCYADDIGWDGGHVAEAVERLKTMGFSEMFKRDAGAFFEREKRK